MTLSFFERANDMTTTGPREGRGRRGLSFFFILGMLLIALGLASPAWGATVTVTDGATPTPTPVGGSPYLDLTAAVAGIGTWGAVNANPRVVTLSGDETYTIGTPGTAAWNFGDGAGAGWGALTISGGLNGSGQRTLTYTGGAAGDQRLMNITSIINSLTIRDINYLAGNITNLTALGGEVYRGGGLYINDVQNAATVTLSNVAATDNTIDVQTTVGTAVGANGAGIYIDGRDTLLNPAAPRGTATLTKVNLIGNMASTMNDTASLGSSANGGGGLINSIATLTYTDGAVESNTAITTHGDHAHGGGLSLEYDRGAASATITGVNFFDNAAIIEAATNNTPVARGGALFVLNEANAANSLTTLSVGSATSTTSFSENYAIAQNSTVATPTGQTASGGAVGLAEAVKATFTNVSFTDNVAWATSAASTARGGAIAQEGLPVNGAAGTGQVDLVGGKFSGNSAEATGLALGGAIYMEGELNANGASFTDNYVRANEIAGHAYGGALFLNGGTTDIADSTFTGNQATAFTHANAMGGAIFADTTSATSAIVNLSASNGKETLFQYNFAGGAQNSIQFASAAGAVSGAAAQLNIDSTGTGKVSLLDPIRVDMTGQNFTFTKTGTGALDWDGENILNSNGNTITLANGTVTLGDSFTARSDAGVDYIVNVNSAATLAFNLSRMDTANPNAPGTTMNQVAMFDFNGPSTTKLFNVDLNTAIGTDLGRRILSINATKFLIADGLAGTEAGDAAAALVSNNPGILSIFGDNSTGEVYGMVNWLSPFDYSGVNPNNAKNALQHLILAKDPLDPDRFILTQDEVDIIRANPRATTPELYMDMGFAFLDAVDTVSRTAMNQGVIQPYHYQTRLGLAPAGPGSGARPAGGRYPTYSSYRANGAIIAPSDRGFRLWAGYIGDFRDIDSSASYNGYKVDRNGFLIGLNYDLDDAASLGFYGGYTYASARAKTIASKNKADAGHFGLIGRVSPFASLRCLSFYGDLGYHFSSNDYWRRLGPNTVNGSFDQGVFTFGLGADYQFRLGGFNIVPSLRARYLYLDQDGMNEAGLTGTHIGGPSKNAFNTRLGVEGSYDFDLGSAVITPAVNLAWRHEFGSKYLTSSAVYLQDPNPMLFGVSASPIDRDSADIGAAVRAKFNLKSKTTLGVNVGYNLNLSKNTTTQTVYAGFEIGF